MPDRYDVFLSYPSADRGTATALKDALEALGQSVWMDTERIDDAESIQRCIVHSLARCRVLVAWYSKHYAQSRPCQWELTAALIVAQTEPCATKRVLVVNPEAGTTHIAQIMVRDTELLPAATSEPMTALAQRLQVAGAQARGMLGDVRRLARPPWHGLKRGLGSNRFVGRLEELWQLHNALTSGRFAIVSGQPSPGAAAGLASVRGSGGMGKSLLAEEYALRFGAFWPGGIFWLDALGVSDRPEESPTALSQRRDSYHLEQLGVLAMGLGFESDGLNLRQLRGRIGHQLQQSGEPYLWLVDDLPQCGRAALDDWQAPSANGCTLITSRARQHEALGMQVELGILQPDDAYALLCRERQPHNAQEEATAGSIAQRLGGHAMAVDQARAACAVQGFSGFLARLDLNDQQALALSKALAGDLPNGHERDIAKTFLSSIDGLSAEALDLLTLAAQLSNAPISIHLVAACKLGYDLARDPDSAASDDMAEHQAVLAAQDWAALTTRELTATSLADPSVVASVAPNELARPAITVHTLIARVARWRLIDHAARTDAPDAAARWRHAAVLGLRRALHFPDDIRQYAALIYEVQHARQLCEQVQTFDDANLLACIAHHDNACGAYSRARAAWQTVLQVCKRVLDSEHPDTLSSMNNLAGTLHAMGELPAARVKQQQVLEVLQRVLGSEHPYTLTSMSNLAVTLGAMGELPAARAMEEQVLSVRQRVLGSEHHATLTSMNNLANTLRAMGELPAARAMLEHVLEVFQRVLGPEHPDTLTSMNNLAVTLGATGERTAERTMEEQVLAVSQRVLGSEHPDALTSMANLAGTLHAIGELPAARVMQARVLAVRQRALGSEHPATLSSMHNLADTLRAMGELPAAHSMQEQVLAVSQRVLGSEHPDTLNSMNNLADILRAMGELPTARAMQAHVLAVRQRALGSEHPDTLTSMSNLADTLRAMGELPTARAMQVQVLAVTQRVHGTEHPAALTSVANLALTLRAMGELPDARAMQVQVLAVSQRVLGPEHPDTLISMSNLADTLRTMGELPAARVMEEHVLEVRQRMLGPEHPDTLNSMNNLAVTLGAMGELPAARAIQGQVLVVSQRVLGPEHPTTLTSMNNLAGTLHAMGELPAARVMQEQVLEVLQRALGPEHPTTLDGMNNLAVTLRVMGELPAARAIHEKELSICQRVLGPEHPDTLGSMNNLACTLYAMGELPAARAMQEQVLAVRQRVLGPEHPDTVGALANVLHMMHEARDSTGIKANAKQYPATMAALMAGWDQPAGTWRNQNNPATTGPHHLHGRQTP